MEMLKNKQGVEETYTYMISENKDRKDKLDKIETYIMNWIFGVLEDKKVNLVKKMEELPRKKDFCKKLKKLDKIAENELHKIGANMPKVPYVLRAINIVAMIFTILISAVHILNNGVSIQIYQSTVLVALFILAFALLLVPISILLINITFIIVMFIKKTIKVNVENYSGKKIIQMSILILIMLALILGIVYLIIPDKYICLDILMVGISILIVKTDNLMTKHNKEILEDYYRLNEVKCQIEEYSFIKDEQINYMELWDEYYIYAVAFGIPIPTVKRLKIVNTEDINISGIVVCQNFYNASKAYLDLILSLGYEKKNYYSEVKDLFDF